MSIRARKNISFKRNFYNYFREYLPEGLVIAYKSEGQTNLANNVSFVVNLQSYFAADCYGNIIYNYARWESQVRGTERHKPFHL